MSIARIQPQSTLTKTTLLLVSTFTVLSSMTLSPTLPAIREQFHAVPDAGVLVPLVLTLHALFIVIGSPLAGYLVDRLGRKPVLALSALIYGLTGSSGLVLEGLYPLLLSRALLGLATAGAFTCATTLIADYYSGPTRTRLTAWQTAIMNFGGVMALLISGLLSDISWHLPFSIYLIGLALLPVILIAVSEPQRTASVRQVANEAHAQRAPIAVLLGLYAIMSSSMLLFFFVPVQLPFYLRGFMHANAAQSGLALAAANLCTGLVALFYSSISPYLDRLRLIALGFAGLGLGLLLIGGMHLYPLAVVGAFLSGAAAGVILPTLGLWIMAITPLTSRGRALSGLTASIFLGQFLSPFISQPLGQRIGLPGAFLAAGAFALCLTLFFLLRQRVTAVGIQQTHAS